jgi:hypothetical protein
MMINMKFWWPGKIERRIVEIMRTLADEKRERNMGSGIPMEIFEKKLAHANKSLVAELEELKTKRTFIHDNRVLLANLAAIITAIVIAFVVPIWQQKQDERADVQSLYQTIIANQDISINNANELQDAVNGRRPLAFPETYIEFPVTENVHKILQRELGIDQYRFLLYYLNQTELLNQKIDALRTRMSTTSSSTLLQSSEFKSYQTTVKALDNESWKDSKLHYMTDTSCLAYFLQRAFGFLEITERDRTISCSSESLNRLFYKYGYIAVEVPTWLRPELRNALNEREPGMGDRLIGL